MELFASSSSSSGPVPAESRKKRGRSSSDGGETAPSSSSSSSSSSHKNYDDARSFAELGLCDWLCQSTTAMGFARPFDIQRACIPAILAGRDVLGCAETGSGKTAAFALPILHHLSQDPYGVFAIVLTPTRELATQIAEQFSALGAAMGVRVALVIGGMNMMQQAATLAQRPHVVIATPGRLRHHLESAAPPAVGRALYLVLDEADRLMAPGFASELQVQWIGRPCFYPSLIIRTFPLTLKIVGNGCWQTILGAMHPHRRTLLFSATMTKSLEELEKVAGKEALRFDLTAAGSGPGAEDGEAGAGTGTGGVKMPARLKQEYLFMPAQVCCWCAAAAPSTVVPFPFLHIDAYNDTIVTLPGEAVLPGGGAAEAHRQVRGDGHCRGQR